MGDARDSVCTGSRDSGTHTQIIFHCSGSLSLCDSNARTEGKRFHDHNVQTVRLRVWRWSTHLELFSSVLRGKKPGKGLGFPGTIAHSRCSTQRSLSRFCPCNAVAYQQGPDTTYLGVFCITPDKVYSTVEGRIALMSYGPISL